MNTQRTFPQLRQRILLALTLLFCSSAAVQAIPPPPVFTFEVNTQPNNYLMQGVNQPASSHYFHPFRLLGAAQALDNQNPPVNGIPPGYHSGYLNTGFVAPFFSGNRLVQFYDCKIEDNPDDFGCNNGFATLSRILMPVTEYGNESASCIRSVLGHELFHHIQFAYADLGGSSGCGAPFGSAACEGHARAMQDKIYFDLDLNPEAECTAPYLGQVNSYLKSTNQPLWAAKYDSALWWTWLMEQYGTTLSEPQRGTDFLARWYIEAAASLDNPNAYLVTDTVIKNHSASDSVVNAFHDFTIANVAKDLDLSDVSAAFRHRYSYRDEDPVPGHTNSQVYAEVAAANLIVPNAGMREANFGVSLFGASYTRWNVSNCPAGSILRFEGDPSQAFQPGGLGIVATPSAIFSVLAVRGGDHGRPALLYKNRSTGWTQDIVQPLDRFDRLISIVAGRDGDVQGVQRVTCDTTAHVASLPFASPTNPVTPGPGGAPWSFPLALDVSPSVPHNGINVLLGDGSVRVFAGTAEAAVLSPVRQSTVANAGYSVRVHAAAFTPPLADGDYDLTVRVGAIERTISQGLRVGGRQAQVLLAIDTSSSMLLPSAGSRLNALKRAARQLVFALPDDARLGLIEMAGNNSEPDDDAVLRVQLLSLETSQRARLRTAIDSLSSGPNRFTSIGDALALAVREFAARAQPRQRKHLVLLCDGSENENARWRDVEQAVIAAGFAVHTIAFGPLADQPLLQQIARATGGSYHYVAVGNSADEAALGDAFSAIVEHIEQRTRIVKNLTLAPAPNQTQTLVLRVPTGLNLGLNIATRQRFYANLKRSDVGPNILAQVRVFDPNGVELIEGVNGARVRRVADDVWFESGLMTGDYTLQMSTGAGSAGAPAMALQVYAGVSAQAGLSLTTGLARPAQAGIDFLLPIDTIKGESELLQVGLLLPAIQKVRDAAARVAHPNGSSDVLALNDSGERGDAAAGDGVWSALYRRTTQGAPTGFPDDLTQAGVLGSVRADIEFMLESISSAAAGPVLQSRAFASLDFAVLENSVDGDADLMPDRYEQRQRCLNPSQPDGSFDADADARVNLLEYQDGTDPCDPDTDGGGETDGSERARGARGQDPSDDALAPMRFAHLESADSEHEGSATLPPNSIPIRYGTHASYSAIRLERASAAIGPFLLAANLSPRVSRGVYIDTQLVPGQRYWYRMLARTAAGQQGAPGPIFSAVARADARATMGAMRLHFGRPRSDDVQLSVQQSIYQKRANTSQYQLQIADQAPGTWQAFSPSVAFAAPSVAAPTQLEVSVRFRDVEGQESISYLDNITLHAPGTLGGVRLRALAGNTSAALAGVLVRIVDSQIEPVALSDSGGNAVLDELLPGSYQIEINAPGLPSVFRPVLISAGTMLNLGDVMLAPASEVVFANGFE